MANVDALRLAVLIDADDATSTVVKDLPEEVTKFGKRLTSCDIAYTLRT